MSVANEELAIHVDTYGQMEIKGVTGFYQDEQGTFNNQPCTGAVSIAVEICLASTFGCGICTPKSAMP